VHTDKSTLTQTHTRLRCSRSLPFLDAIRVKRTAATKDVLPDEVFGRIR
jgi:hypothetical protein